MQRLTGIKFRSAYDAWGNVLSVTGEDTAIGELNPIRYRGYYQDTETGLYYLQSRYYDPTTMRFINADDPNIIQMGSTEKQELNLYAYCVNDPVNCVDPTGYYGRQLALAGSLTAALNPALPGIIASISASIASIKAAIVSAWLPILCISAVALAIVGIVYVIKKINYLMASSAKVISVVKSLVGANGINPNQLKNNSVYVIVPKGSTDVIYVGRTCNFQRRKAAHQRKRFLSNKYDIFPVATNLSLAQARALEQTLITAYGIDTLKNLINSISPSKWGFFKSEFSQMQTLIGSFFDPE